MSLVPTLTAEECVALLQGLRTVASRPGGVRPAVRNWGMGMVLLEAGLRVGELVGLNVGDLWFAGNPVRSLVVRGEIAKRHVERVIPVSVRLDGAIRELARVVWVMRDLDLGTPAWYCGPARRRLTARQVESIVRRAALRSLGRPVHPHVLRHTFGTRMEQVGGIRVAQALLGHKDIRTTEIYCHPGADRLLAAVNGLRLGEGNGGG